MAGMDSLDKELAELKEFIADLKTDRAAQKEKEKRESWTKYTSMSLVFIAVLAAIATQWAGKFSGRVLVALNDATYNQALASDQWGYYQASSIKQNLYETIHDLPSNDAAATGADAAKREEAFKAKVQKYTANKDDASKQAKDREDKRDQARALATTSSTLGGQMGKAVSIFQISIAIGSICLVTKKKWLWYVALLLAAAATAQMLWVILS
jgi:Domain of unknown function (DUF4337)